MNEIELYIELLDDKACTKILKDFGETVPGFSKNPPLQQKKQFIKSMFKGQMSRNWKGRNTKTNRFYTHISAYKNTFNDEQFGKYDEKGLLRQLAEVNHENLPDHAKLAVALIYQPEGLKAKLPLLVENFKQNKNVFDIPIFFESEEELANHLSENASFLGEFGIDNFLHKLKEIFTDEELTYVEELNPIVAEMTLLDFQNKRREFKGALDFLSFFAFAITHKNESQEIRIGMALHSAYYLAEVRHKKMDHFVDQIHELEEDIRKYTQSIEIKDKLQLQLQETKEQLKAFEKEKRQYEKDKKELNVTVSKLTANTHKLEKDYEKKIQALLTQQEKTIEAQKQELLEAGKQVAAAEQKMKQFTDELAHQEPVPTFAVVHHEDSELFSLIFPEINVFSTTQFTQRNDKIKHFTKLYIQRDGLNSTMIYKIQDVCQKNLIDAEFFFARSNKELLEKIAYFKQINKGV